MTYFLAHICKDHLFIRILVIKLAFFYELYRFELFKKYLLDMRTVSIKRIGFKIF